MTFQSLRSKVESFIRQAEIGPALALIESYTDKPNFSGSSFRDNALLLSSRFASLKDQHIKGTLSHDDYSKELARLSESILSLLRAPSSPISSPFPLKETLMIVVLVALLGLGAWWMFRPEKAQIPVQIPVSTMDSPKVVISIPTTVHDAGNQGIKPDNPPASNAGGHKANTPTSDRVEPPKSPTKKEEPVQEKISVSIKADACWRDASIMVDGNEVGSLEGIMGEIELVKKPGGNKILLVKDGKSSPAKTLTNQNYLNFKCE